MSDLLTLGEIYALLRKAVKEAGSQTAFAVRHGMSSAYVCDVLNARREPGPKVLAALNVVPVVRFKAISVADKAA